MRRKSDLAFEDQTSVPGGSQFLCVIVGCFRVYDKYYLNNMDYKNCDTPQPDAISRRAKLTSGGFRQAQPTPGRLCLTELGATTERSTERDEQNK